MSKPSTSLWFHNVEICVRLPLLTLLPLTLYRCPFCNFPALLDKDMSLFSCPNPRCRKVSPLSTLSHQGSYLYSSSCSQSDISVPCNPASEFYHYVRQRRCSRIKRKSVGMIQFGVVVKMSVWGMIDELFHGGDEVVPSGEITTSVSLCVISGPPPSVWGMQRGGFVSAKTVTWIPD